MLDITPDTRVADLLEAYPALEPVLIRMAPAFERLSNPVLRRTIARVATLRQAASIGGTPLGQMINELRRAAGCDQTETSMVESGASQLPPGFQQADVVQTLDARPLLDAGEHPISTVLQSLRRLSAGQYFELVTPFLPAPLIDLAEKQGYEAWSVQSGEVFRTYFRLAEKRGET